MVSWNAPLKPKLYLFLISPKMGTGPKNTAALGTSGKPRLGLPDIIGHTPPQVVFYQCNHWSVALATAAERAQISRTDIQGEQHLPNLRFRIVGADKKPLPLGQAPLKPPDAIQGDAVPIGLPEKASRIPADLINGVEPQETQLFGQAPQ
jgi:hypothetical protein